MGNTTMEALAKVGTSAWLDDLSRQRLTSGDLKNLIEELRVVGVTTNPAIFSSAMTAGEDYDSQLAQLTAEGANPADAVFAMAIDDVRDACDLFAGVSEETDGVDGRVSIEVDPRYADNYEATIAQARKLWERVGKQNAMIKIPATDASLPAVTQALSEGISVNVTLIFSVERYLQVIDAFIEGIERAKDNGVDLASVHSVASLFVSRVDTEIDARLDKIGSVEALALRGKAGLANARAAYAKFEETFSAQNIRWAQLENAGAKPQRLLWASTGVKNPAYPDTLYVTELAAPQTVNTMPEKTLRATAGFEGEVRDAVSGQGEAANAVMTQLSEIGIDLDDVFAVLEREGVEKFVDSWQSLLESIAQRMEQLK
ncbi:MULTISPECIES: transaldolase [Corynebacterium]|uniref:transaldolase n=1 Tax=Corynebacterium TaxID=1716 RepID=UPI0008A1C435|nr:MULTISPECIES: transaldolase [Corynebacterium]ASE55954.1 transaldolase [Corynebacterium jeikeium]AYX81774.1 transaldolase [Corynebacterium jeikeium]KAA0885744.1 transaldolase [Corynebacterium amycolatum]KAA9227645.1 transaldolase [Corynebacterium amycolatum]OFT71344.1 transaldolase [Corynebacterium sp. HMSC14B06]